MKNNEIIQGIYKIVESSMQYAEVSISPQKKFEENGINSLLFIKIIAEIETVYDIEIDVVEISDLYELSIFEFILCIEFKIKMKQKNTYEKRKK